MTHAHFRAALNAAFAAALLLSGPALTGLCRAEEPAPPASLGAHSLTGSGSHAMKVVGMEDSGRVLAVGVGRTFAVSLVAGKADGYGYRLDNPDEKYVIYVDREAEPRADGSLLTTWYFRTVSPGTYELKLVPTAPGLKPFSVILDIASGK